MANTDIQEVRCRMLKHVIGKETIAAFTAKINGLEPSYVSQLLNAHRPLGEKAARNLEHLIGLRNGYLDQLLPGVEPMPLEWYVRKYGAGPGADRFERAKSSMIAERTPSYIGDAVPGSAVRVTVPEEPPIEGEIRIPEEEVEFSGGYGRELTYREPSTPNFASFTAAYFQRERMNPLRCKRFRVVGNSMEPLLYPGDSILVNLEENQVREGFVYAFRHGNELKVKKLIPKADGGLILRSINREEYPDDYITPEQMQQDITIIGRVRDRSGRGGL